MKLIPCKSARVVAFSKRRSMLFEKANKLCTLTGCEIAMVVFSQSGFAYSYGHPSIERVSQRFLNEAQRQVAQPAGGSVTSGLNQECNELCETIDAVKQIGKKLAEDQRRAHVPFWMGTPIHELSNEQVIQATKSLEQMREDFEKRTAEISQKGPGKRSCMNANVPGLNFPPNDV